MDLVPLIYAALAITSTLSAVESAALNLETSSKEKDHVLELRQKENEKVRFDVIASRSIEEPPAIEVTLNEVKYGLELTHYRMNDESTVGCNYLGYLRNNPASSVAVTGCLNKPGDRMEVTMISENNMNKIFTVDFNGNAEIIKNPFEEGALSRAIKLPTISLGDRNFNNSHGDEIFDDTEEQQVATAKISSIPSTLKAVIKFGYEDGLNSELTEDFNSWIARVFTHTQAHFRHAASLGTTIEFEVQGSAVYQQGSTWTADEANIWNARAATNSLGLDGVDVMSWWCKHGGGGIAGIAYVGTLCSSYNTNLNEKQSYAAGSGFVLAHELGHNFGMSHDFDDKHGGRDGPCNGKGIMSYGSYRYDQWSTCSKKDWEAHYFGMNWGQGCLEDISECAVDADCAVGAICLNETCAHDGYEISTNSWCSPYYGKFQTLQEAKNQCRNEPSCTMLYGTKTFQLCAAGSKIKTSSKGNTLYIKRAPAGCEVGQGEELGVDKGTCEEGQICQENGECVEAPAGCEVGQGEELGVDKGTCEEGQICQENGECVEGGK